MIQSVCFNNYANFAEVTHTAITVGTGSTSVITAREDRAYLLLYNDGDETIYINLDGAAAMNTGIGIRAGESYVLSGANANMYKGAITGICTTGGKKLLVTEGV